MDDITPFLELGVGGVLAVIIFLMYRIDRKDSQETCRRDHLDFESRLTAIIEADRESREQQTDATMKNTIAIEKQSMIIDGLGDLVKSLRNGHGAS